MRLAHLVALERGEADAGTLAALAEALRTWRSGPLVPWSAAEYRRAKRDGLLLELAHVLAPRAGPATQARRVYTFLALAQIVRQHRTPAEQIAAELLELGEPVPRERQLRAVFGNGNAKRCRIARAESVAAGHSRE